MASSTSLALLVLHGHLTLARILFKSVERSWRQRWHKNRGSWRWRRRRNHNWAKICNECTRHELNFYLIPFNELRRNDGKCENWNSKLVPIGSLLIAMPSVPAGDCYRLFLDFLHCLGRPTFWAGSWNCTVVGSAVRVQHRIHSFINDSSSQKTELHCRFHIMLIEERMLYEFSRATFSAQNDAVWCCKFMIWSGTDPRKWFWNKHFCRQFENITF